MPMAVLVTMGFLGMICWPIAVWLLLGARKQFPVLYLRAFRTDRSARRLRSLLKASLGPRFRLCGIRPPRKRFHWSIRFFAIPLIGLKYIGSEYFELEAEDHNWMARLLASYARSNFVFIDVRDITLHVENEILLSYLAMGSERCVFIIDSTRTETAWLSTIRGLIQLGPTDQPPLHLLSYSEDEPFDPALFVQNIRAIVEKLSITPATINENAIAFAQNHVSESRWATPFLETDRGTFFMALAVGFGFSVVSSLFPETAGVLDVLALSSLGIGAPVIVFYLIAWRRAWKQSKVAALFRQPNQRDPRWRVRLSLLLVFLGLAISMVSTLGLTIHKMDENIDHARHFVAHADIQGISTQLKLYESMNGFYPTTDQGLRALAVQPDTDPKPSRWLQLFDKIPKDPWQSDYIYRCPGLKNPNGFDLYSAGPDRVPDTADDDWGGG